MYLDITDAVCTDSDQFSAVVLATGGTHEYFGNTFQRGETVTLSVTPTPGNALPTNVVYVWEFWDGSVETTNVPYVSKLLNRSGLCNWRCIITDEIGAARYVYSSVSVHASPSVSGIVVSSNAEAVPFTSTITVYASSPYGLTLIYTWRVNGVVQAETSNVLSLAVASVGTYSVTCTVDDDYGGTDIASVTVFGLANINPQVSPIAQSPSRLRKGTFTGTFYVTAIDPEGHAMTFTWLMDGVTPLSSTETVEGAQTKSTATINLAPVTAADHTFTCLVTDSHGGSTLVSLTSHVYANNPPVITSCTRTPSTVTGGLPIAFSATATDADYDLLYYSWAFGACAPLGAITMTGATVIYPTVAGQAGNTLTATLTVTDALGASVSQAAPSTLIT